MSDIPTTEELLASILESEQALTQRLGVLDGEQRAHSTTLTHHDATLTDHTDRLTMHGQGIAQILTEQDVLSGRVNAHDARLTGTENLTSTLVTVTQQISRNGHRAHDRLDAHATHIIGINRRVSRLEQGDGINWSVVGIVGAGTFVISALINWVVIWGLNWDPFITRIGRNGGRISMERAIDKAFWPAMTHMVGWAIFWACVAMVVSIIVMNVMHNRNNRPPQQVPQQAQQPQQQGGNPNPGGYMPPQLAPPPPPPALRRPNQQDQPQAVRPDQVTQPALPARQG